MTTGHSTSPIAVGQREPAAVALSDVPATSATPVNVIIYNDHPVFKSAISWKIGENHGIEFVADTVSVYDTLRVTAERSPDAIDAIVADLRIGDGNSEGVESVRTIAGGLGGIPVVVCTDFHYPSYASQLSAAGATAIVQKSAPAETLVKAILDSVTRSRAAAADPVPANGSAA